MSKVTPIDAPRITVEHVTPQMAAQMLGTMIGNRMLRQRVVARYAREMIAGKWLLNGESIKVSREGKLVDGQHRLNAIIAAGVTVPMAIVRGVDSAAFLTLDTGCSRSYHDAATIAGREWLSEVASFARWWIKYERGVNSTASKITASHQEIDDLIERHPGIPDSARFVKSLKVVQNKCSAGVQGFVHAYAAERYDREMADSFMQDLNDGARLEKTSPIYALRSRLVDYSDRKPDAGHILALTIKAWNAWMNGEKMLAVKWRTGGDRPEEFPRFLVDTASSGAAARQRRRAVKQRDARASGA
jgi:hypothetical protein